jgi:uncharacterized ion transporter superfamily protein YfcC
MAKTIEEKKKSGFKFPDTYVLIAVMITVMAILTYIVPAGKYEMIKNAAGIPMVDPNSFKFVPRTPTTAYQLLDAFYIGLNRNYSMIFYVLLIGGYFKIINETKAISNGLSAVINRLKEKSLIAIPIVMICFHLLGSTGVLVNPVIAFIPIGLIVASQMKIDRIAALSIIYLSCYAGWGTSFMAVGSVQLAQKMAEVKVLSGIELRAIVTIITCAVTIFWTMRYCAKIRKDKTQSLLYGTEWEGFGDLKEENAESISFTAKDFIILVLVFGALTIYVYGAIKYSWSEHYMTVFMCVAAIISGFISGMTANQIAQSFMRGVKEMVYGAVLIGFASGISVVLTDGQIIHTLIYYASLPLKVLPTTLSAVVMFYINSVFNFFVTSASGQAAIVMPIMAPLADVVGVTRQVSILAYQYGDGLSNTVVPTSGVLMAALGIAGVPLQKWLKFQIPLFLIWTLICTIAIIVAVMIGYN